MAILIPYVKQTWIDGSGGGTPVSAARLGVVEEGILDVSQAPAVHVTHNAAQSIANITATVLAFNTERFDQAGGVASTQHDTVTNNSRLTCLYAGIYLIGGQIEFAANATGTLRQIELLLNGATTLAFHQLPPSATAGNNRLNVTTLYQLAVNDYVQLRCFQDSGGALNVNATAAYTPEFWMSRIA